MRNKILTLKKRQQENSDFAQAVRDLEHQNNIAKLQLALVLGAVLMGVVGIFVLTYIASVSV